MNEIPKTITVNCPNINCKAEQQITVASQGKYSGPIGMQYHEVICKECGAMFLAAIPDKSSSKQRALTGQNRSSTIYFLVVLTNWIVRNFFDLFTGFAGYRPP